MELLTYISGRKTDCNGQWQLFFTYADMAFQRVTFCGKNNLA
jgi:hypothetical protein